MTLSTLRQVTTRNFNRKNFIFFSRSETRVATTTLEIESDYYTSSHKFSEQKVTPNNNQSKQSPSVEMKQRKNNHLLLLGLQSTATLFTLANKIHKKPTKRSNHWKHSTQKEERSSDSEIMSSTYITSTNLNQIQNSQ